MSRGWMAAVLEGQVHGHGTTLKSLRRSLEQGLRLLLPREQMDALDLRIIPSTPALDEVRRAEASLEAAREAAVRELSVRQISMPDIKVSTGLTMRQVREIRARVNTWVDTRIDAQ